MRLTLLILLASLWLLGGSEVEANAFEAFFRSIGRGVSKMFGLKLSRLPSTKTTTTPPPSTTTTTEPPSDPLEIGRRLFLNSSKWGLQKDYFPIQNLTLFEEFDLDNNTNLEFLEPSIIIQNREENPLEKEKREMFEMRRFIVGLIKNNTEGEKREKRAISFPTFVHRRPHPKTKFFHFFHNLLNNYLAFIQSFKEKKKIVRSKRMTKPVRPPPPRFPVPPPRVAFHPPRPIPRQPMRLPKARAPQPPGHGGIGQRPPLRQPNARSAQPSSSQFQPSAPSLATIQGGGGGRSPSSSGRGFGGGGGRRGSIGSNSK